MKKDILSKKLKKDNYQRSCAALLGFLSGYTAGDQLANQILKEITPETVSRAFESTKQLWSITLEGKLIQKLAKELEISKGKINLD